MSRKSATVNPAVPETSPTVAAPAAPKSTLTPEQILLGATNDPALSKDEFKLGTKTYKYIHLSYDYYIEFMLKLKPLLTGVVGTLASKAKATVTIPGIDLIANPLGSMISFAGEDIPDMVRIIINNYLEAEGKEDEKITSADIKKIRGITPMSLSNIIMGQVIYNNMIPEFASFFVQLMPILNQMGILKTNQAK